MGDSVLENAPTKKPCYEISCCLGKSCLNHSEGKPNHRQGKRRSAKDVVRENLLCECHRVCCSKACLSRHRGLGCETWRGTLYRVEGNTLARLNGPVCALPKSQTASSSSLFLQTELESDRCGLWGRGRLARARGRIQDRYRIYQ